jgi:muramidase (phage lysozyme)
MGPDELDDLLASIRAEGKNDSALALYEGTRETDIVDESVDERILKILGLDGVYDIDYGTYLTLLKEKLAASRLPGTKIPREEDELILNEFKRVKGKVGRFKIKKKKITSENIGVTGPVKVSTEKFYLTSKAVIPQPELSNVEGSQDIKDINEALDKLLESIIGQNKETKKKAEEDKKADEKRKRTKRESELEKPLAKAVSLVKKIVAPFQSILDRIMKFIQFTLLGYFVDKILKWFADPKNEGKIKVIGRFLKDWWPALLTAYGLFATPFGKFIRTTLTLLRGWVPQIAKFIAANPYVFLAAASGIGAYAATQMNEQKRNEFKKTDKTIVTPEETAKTGKTPGIPQLQQEQILQRGFGGAFSNGGRIKRKSFFGGGQVDRAVNVNDIAFDGGGGIDDNSGIRITGAGPDTQLIAAQPGEIVMSKKTVDDHGANFFLGLNKRSGGTNIPKMVNNIQLAQNGGMVGGRMMRSGTGGGTGGNVPEYQRPEVKGILKALLFSEGTGKTSNPYNTVFGGRQMPIDKMSIGDLVRTQMTDRLPKSMGGKRAPWAAGSVASGAYQFMPDTLKQLMSMGKASPNQLMTPGNQDRLAWELMKRRGLTYQTLKKEGLSRNVSDMLAGEWASLPNRSGVSNYGQPVKPLKDLQKIYNETLKMGPQSRATPPGTPVISSRTQTIVLPPIKSNNKKSGGSAKTDSQIPDFQIISGMPYRGLALESLGIDDLMGVG